MAVFVGGMLGLAILAAIVVFASQPPPPDAPCQPGQQCAPPPDLPPISQLTPRPTLPPTRAPTSAPTSLPTAASTSAPTPLPSATPSGAPGTAEPTSLPTAGPTASPAPSVMPGTDSPPAVSGEVWRSETLGFSFEYDPEIWSVNESADDRVTLAGNFFDALVIVHAVDAGTSSDELIEQELADIDQRMIGRVRDKDEYDALLGPSIGYIRGTGDVYGGTMTSPDGTPIAPGGVTILASTDGRLTVSVQVIVFQPDLFFGGETHQHAVRSTADHFLKSFDWGSQ